MELTGESIYKIAEKIFPICRSITGNGVRKTLRILQETIPELKIYEVPSGTQVFDWEVPKEWNISDGYIEDVSGTRIIDFNQLNLYIMGYSLPVDQWVDLEELKTHIYTEPSQPEAVPYVTSYYKENYGFCMSEHQKEKLFPGKYHMVIKSSLEYGSLTYGEILIPGETEKEIFLSTYICHPSMGNNECSGPALLTALAVWIKQRKHRYYSYRIIFIPEAIGAITYLSSHLSVMQERTVAGYNLSCVGDNMEFSMIESKYGNTLADKMLDHILKWKCPGYKKYSFLQRGSDERQYNAVGIELPVCGFSRTKFHEYPQYHTSADNLKFINAEGFEGSFMVMKECLEGLEKNKKYRIMVCGEPQLGKRGLYPTTSQKGSSNKVKTMMDFIAYADGKNTLLEISELIHIPVYDLYEIVNCLMQTELLTIIE